MKFVFTWRSRTPDVDVDYDGWVEDQRRVFEGWVPEQGVEILHFLWRADATGGFAVVEVADGDVRKLARSPAIFNRWFEYEIIPVMDIPDALEISREALEFRKRNLHPRLPLE